MKPGAPNTEIATEIAATIVGHQPISVRRFSAGLHHYVFEATFKDRPSVVIRMATQDGRPAMEGALKLSNLLRPRGVPLPEILVEGLGHPFPYLVLERLPGTDLGNSIKELSAADLHAIAVKVAQAQGMTAGTATAGRYGYSVDPKGAPYDKWSEVLQASLSRSRKRIAAAELFSQDTVDVAAGLVSQLRTRLDAVPAIPFLHDITTKNVIVTPGGDFSGIVDVDDLCFGDPRYVVALTLASLTASGGPTRYVDAWMRIANYQNDRIFRLYVLLFIVEFMSEHGQAFNGNIVSSSVDDRARLLRTFAECVEQLRDPA